MYQYCKVFLIKYAKMYIIRVITENVTVCSYWIFNTNTLFEYIFTIFSLKFSQVMVVGI